MKRWKKITLITGISLASLLLLAVIAYNVLLSGYAVRNWWLPLAGSKTGCVITADSAAVSLFGSETLVLTGLKVSKPGELEVAIDRLDCRAALPGWLAGGGPLRIETLELGKVTVAYTAPREEEKAARKRSAASKSASGEDQTLNFTLPVAVESLKVTSLDLDYRAPEQQIAVAGGTLEVRNLAAGERFTLTLAAGFDGAVRELEFDQGALSLTASAAMPASGLPADAELTLTAGAGIAAPELERTAIAAEAKMLLARQDDGRIRLEKAPSP